MLTTTKANHNKMKNTAQHNADATFSLKYHLVWCPKYRRPLLQGQVATRLTELLRHKSDSLEIEILAVEIMPDHVHLFVTANPTQSPAYLVSQFKGFTSKQLRTEFNHLATRFPTLWSRSYYAGSVGEVSTSTVKHYIENQKSK
jgi:putative transposase